MNFLDYLTKKRNSVTKSICAESFTGEKGKAGAYTEGTGKECARDLGIGWKISPSIIVPKKGKFILADIKESGQINHIWCTCFPTSWRNLILRVYWDNCDHPSIQAPIGDFFLNGWCERSNVQSLLVTVNPAGGFNSYFQMPFKERAIFEIENISNEDIVFYYQIDYEAKKHDSEIMYFHAFWNRVNPLPYKDVYTLLPKISGNGHYIGTYMAYQVNSNGWWGEGEIKFYLDGDDKFPSICGTGTEDYFGGAWNFEHPKGEYGLYSTMYQGLHQVIKSDGLYKANMRFGMYRWHALDPICFTKDIFVTIQALGWRSGARYLPLQDDIASVVYWYQDVPNKTLVINTDPDHLEVIL